MRNLLIYLLYFSFLNIYIYIYIYIFFLLNYDARVLLIFIIFSNKSWKINIMKMIELSYKLVCNEGLQINYVTTHKIIYKYSNECNIIYQG